MTPAQLRSELERFIRLGLEDGFVLAFQTPIIREASDGRRIVSPPAVGAERRNALRERFASLAEYRHLLRSGDYLAVLSDGSILHLSYSFSGNEIVSHRLAYYPCPVRVDPDEVESSGTLEEYVDLALAQDGVFTREHDDPLRDQSTIRMAGTIRFDFDKEPKPDHPACHAHVTTQGSRIPVFGPLTPGQFFHFVLRNFSPSIWAGSADLKSWPLGDVTRTILHPGETCVMHINVAQELPGGPAAA